MKDNKKKLLRTLKTLWVIWGIIFTLYLFWSYQAKGVDKQLLQSSNAVKVVNSTDEIRFIPQKDKTTSGLIFYPGAMVAPMAYTPLARHIADRGYEVIILKLPLRSAPFESHKEALFSRTIAITQRDRTIDHWILAGHSKGGALAAEFARYNADSIDALILIGTSHPKNFDLSHLKIPITKVLATNDGLASEKEVRANAKNLPPDTDWITVEGGNHAQFGYYGYQLGDDKAEITREAQQEILLKAIIKVLEKASSK